MKSKLIMLGAVALLIGVSIAKVVRPSLPEREQAQTVLVETKDGWGSAVTVTRGDMCFAWTAAHVVEEDAKVKVHRFYRFLGNKAGEYVCDAHVLKLFPKQDVALLLIEGDPSKFEDAIFSRSTGKPGQKITHVGNGFGPEFDTMFESGIVSQNGVTVKAEDCLLDQGSFAILPGCSGGPVFNTSGKVIGIVLVYVGPGVSLYVPMRQLDPVVSAAGFSWALHGYGHAPVSELSDLIEAREKEIEKRPPVDLFRIFFGAPPEKK